MCPVDTDVPAVSKFAYSHKQKQLRHFMNKGQSFWKPQDYMDHFKSEQDIQMLSIAAKVPKVPFEIT